MHSANPSQSRMIDVVSLALHKADNDAADLRKANLAGTFHQYATTYKTSAAHRLWRNEVEPVILVLLQGDAQPLSTLAIAISELPCKEIVSRSCARLQRAQAERSSVGRGADADCKGRSE